MPIHDWRQVMAGVFHHFHQTWISEICNTLNGGVLPEGYYAMAEQVAGGPHPDVLTLEAIPDSENGGTVDFSTGKMPGATAVADPPPQLRYTLEAEEAIYAAKADRIAISHASGDRVVAFVEIISPGNKHSESSVRQLIDKLSRALARGCHLLIIDLFPPGRHDPQGLHVELWGKPDPVPTAEEPLILAAYKASPSPIAYVEPTSVGQSLTDMPLFLTEDYYVNLPLEQTYQAAWTRVPDRWKHVIQPASA